jgi:23S rRNA pseudouridine1911/1915/1917 synthase
LDQDRAQLVYVTHNKEKGKLAITSYSVMAAKKEYSLLDVHIDSGRKNQIRVQLGNIGHYVIGDDKYGEPSNPLRRLGLHAYELDLTNPLNGKEYKFTAPMPSSFKAMFFGKVARNETAQNPKPFNETPRPRYERKGLHARRHHRR